MPILECINKECGGVVKTNALGSQPVISIEHQGDYDPCLIVGNEVVRVGYQLAMNKKYRLDKTPMSVVREVERVFTKVNTFYDYNLLRISANFYGSSWPLMFDVWFYQSGHSETLIIPRQFENTPLSLRHERLHNVHVPINIIEGYDEVKAALKSTNLLALIRNISGTIGANVDDCLSLLH